MAKNENAGKNSDNEKACKEETGSEETGNEKPGNAGGSELALSLGNKILALRQRYGLSQRELARRADMTNSSLSNIEQGKVSPSIASLEKILNAVPISLQSFFSDNLELNPPIVRAKDLMFVKKDGVENRVMPITEQGKIDAYLARQRYAPGARIHSEWMVRQGYVGGMVVSGQLHLVLEGTSYSLEEGDGFYFALHRSHVFENRSQKDCIVVSVSIAH